MGMLLLGDKAIEFQQYALNANFTVNLLHSLFGVDYYNILDCPTNGFRLLHFFEDAVEIQRPDGSVLFEGNNCVVMDYCGFHHCLFVESVLREIWMITAFNSFTSPLFSTSKYLWIMFSATEGIPAQIWWKRRKLPYLTVFCWFQQLIHIFTIFTIMDRNCTRSFNVKVSAGIRAWRKHW